MKTYLISILLIIGSLSACTKDDSKNNDNNKHEIPIEIEKPDVPIKPIQMWIDAHANLSRFADKKNITTYMEKMKATGFNEIYVDVKPGIGYALYDSDILPQLRKWGDITVDRDWDYLAFWIEEAERLDMSVIASLSVMGYGYTKTKEGLIYDDNKWDGKTQM